MSQKTVQFWVTTKTNSVFISAPVNALVEGLYEENTSIAEIKTHGDFGIGTFNNLDGEMVILENEVFQLKSDGTCESVADSVLTPFPASPFLKKTPPGMQYDPRKNRDKPDTKFVYISVPVFPETPFDISY